MKNFCIDKPDKRDYLVSNYLGSNKELPKSVLLDNWQILNQAKPWYEYACVFFASSEVYNTQNDRGNSIEAEWLSDKAVEKWLLDSNSGAYIQSGPKLLKQLWRITSYARCKNIEDMKKSLADWRPILVWSNSIDWSETRKKWIAVRWNSYWHGFQIPWYSDPSWVFICENTYWEDNYVNWLFLIKYEDIDLLYHSKYVFFDYINPIFS